MEKEENMSETVKTIIYAIVIAVLIRSFLFEPFKIPSGSMYPNLYVGDFLFVSKYTYGYSRHSFPFSFPPFEGRIWSSEPKQGDVVVFKFPKDNRTDFIKRIIGMPGDRIKLENGRLFVNGKMLERVEGENFVLRNPFGHAERYHQYTETLPNGVKHSILEISDEEREDNFEEVTVPRAVCLSWATTATVPMTAGSASVSCRWKTWSARRAFCFSPTIRTKGPGTSPGPGRKKSDGAVCSAKSTELI